MLVGAAAQGLGGGVFVPYIGIYLTRDLGATGAQAGLIYGAMGLAGLIGAPIGGLLADRVGRRPTMLASLAGSTVFFVVFGAASSITAIVAILPLAFLSDLLPPAFGASTADLIADDGLRIEAFALERVVSNVAFAVGPPLGGLLAFVWSLRLVFFVCAATGLLYFLVVLLRVPETLPAGDAVTEHERPRLRTALRDRRLLALAIGSAMATFVYVQYNDALGLFLVHDRGYAVATWGLVFGINPVIVTFFQYPVSRWAASRSPRAILATGALLQGLALLILLPFSPLPWLLVSVLLLVTGEMLTAPLESALAARLAPPHLRGSYQGVLDFAFAASFGPAAFTGIALAGSGHGEVFLAYALPLSAVAALCFLRVPARPAGERGLAPA